MKKGLIAALGWGALAVVTIVALNTVRPPAATAPVATATASSEASYESYDTASSYDSTVSASSASVSSSSVAAFSAAPVPPETTPAVKVAETKPLVLTRRQQHCQDRVTRLAARGLQFRFDAYELTPKGRAHVRQIARAVARCPGMTVKVTGHTDNVGSENQNRLVSAARAEAVAKVLAIYGIAPDRIEHTGAGSADPAASNATHAGRRANRRVDFTLIPR